MRCLLRSIWDKLGLYPILVLSCALLTLGSCRSTLLTRAPSPGDMAVAIKSAMIDPFKGVDHDRFTRSSAAMTVVNHRVKPATAAAGKRSLTLEDCRSTALANNLELQVARVDELTKAAIEYSNKTRMLPHFLFSGDLSQRDNPPYSFSDVLGREGMTPEPASGGTGVTNYSVSHERSTWRYVLETRWSPTDAALAYYVSKSSINDRLKAHYHKVRVAQKLVAVVDSSFMRLLSIQHALALAEALVASRASVADKMKRAYERNLVGMSEFNRARQDEIRARRLLGRARTEHEKQRNILASAMGLSPEYCVDGGFLVVGELSAPRFDAPLCDIEMRAVQNRPEAFEAGLNHLTSLNDLKRTMVKYLPKVSGFWRYTRDKDRFLYNKDWKEVGCAIYFDLVDWLANVKESQAARSNAVKTEREIGTVALGITSQARLAALQYFDALDEFKSTEEALASTREVVRVATHRAAKDDLERLALEESKADLYQDQFARVRALGEVNALLAELHGAMGTNYSEPPPRYAATH